ncbi:MAG: shikimate kinase [SAR324 cluster bacterium]|nr:shikimate kinase [SAR324 cluster bacterium]
MNIFLIGFMGAGKTTVGKQLARRLGYHFLDMDEFIESEQGCSISDIFKYMGEEYFRNQETQLLQRLSNVQSTVVSTGGGIVTRDENLRLMKSAGKVIYLQTPLTELSNRLKFDNKRPLLQAEDAEVRMKNLLETRQPLYEQADYIIKTEGLSSYAVASLILKSI